MKICSVCRRCFEESEEFCTETGHAPLSESRAGHLDIVPGYSLESLYDSGIKFDIFRARRIDCDRPCLIKVFTTDDQTGTLFLREAEVAGSLFHPGVAEIYEFGRLAENKYFIVLESDGEQTLQDYLETSDRPDLLTAIRIVQQIAEALHAIHEKALVHGAIRPYNILLTFDAEGLPSARIRNIDLGGVEMHNTTSNRFLLDSAINSIRYFAPEQCTGIPAIPKSDVYSLGVVFFELLVGAPPFDAPNAVTLMEMHRNHRPPEVLVDDFHLRMLVTHSLSESLQKQPEFRQASASAFARQMRHIEQLATHVSTPPPALATAVQPQYRTAAAPSRSFTSGPISEVSAVGSGNFNRKSRVTTGKEIGADNRETLTRHSGSAGFAAIEKVVSADRAKRISNLATPHVDRSAPEEDVPPVPAREAVKGSSLIEHRLRLKQMRRRASVLTDPPFTKLEEAASPTSRFSERASQPRSTAASVAFTEMPANRPNVETQPAIPKLIEWHQPDGDVPSLEEVRKVVEMDAAIVDGIPGNALVAYELSATYEPQRAERYPNDHGLLFETALNPSSLGPLGQRISVAARKALPLFAFGSVFVVLGLWFTGESRLAEQNSTMADLVETVAPDANGDSQPKVNTVAVTVATPKSTEPIPTGETESKSQSSENGIDPGASSRTKSKAQKYLPSRDSVGVPAPRGGQTDVTPPVASKVVITYNKEKSEKQPREVIIVGRRPATASIAPETSTGPSRPRIVVLPRN